MGLLTTGGLPMQWGTDANNKAIPHVTAHGIQQFLNVFKKNKDKDNSPFLWGEELEHLYVHVEDGRVFLDVAATELMERMSAQPDCDAVWHPEYGAYMPESTPKYPYSLAMESLCSVEENMKHRYRQIDECAAPGSFGVTLVTFPAMGVGKFLTSDSTESPYSQSLFIPDAAINSIHPRFANLTANIRLRRGRKVCIQVPLFIDTNTMEKTVDKRLNIDFHPRNTDIDCGVKDEKKKKTAKFGASAPSFPDSDADVAVVDAATPETVPYSPIDPREKQYPAAAALTHLFTPATLYYYGQYFSDKQRENVKKRYDACPCPVPSVSHPCIYMDCMAFGMGDCCLQVTMQLKNIHEARHVYDQLACLCPVFLALSSATPFQKGLLCDSDVRWLTIAASVDDRKREEVPRIVKSRYDSISVFISDETENLDQFNDSAIEISEPYYDVLTANGVDSRLAKHVSHLFIRDPLVLYDQMIDIDDNTHSTHFENIQTSNWQTVRFKPPPIEENSGIDWRVEFRVLEIQPTPFENAAFSVFIALLTKAITKYKPTFYTKMSIVDENMGRAHRIDPCSQLYVMRKDIFATKYTSDDSENEKLSIDEVFNGKEGGYYGLIPLVRRYLVDEKKENALLEQYLRFLSMRASGKIPTAAQYLRQFVMKHPDYKHDSRLTEKIAFDVTKHVHDLAFGLTHDDSYLPMTEFSAEPAKDGRKRPRED